MSDQQADIVRVEHPPAAEHFELRRGLPIDVIVRFAHAGITQRELADRLGWTMQRIGKYDRGENLPTADSLLALLEACGWKIHLVRCQTRA